MTAGLQAALNQYTAHILGSIVGLAPVAAIVLAAILVVYGASRR
jgi:hypothetical protein